MVTRTISLESVKYFYWPPNKIFCVTRTKYGSLCDDEGAHVLDNICTGNMTSRLNIDIVPFLNLFLGLSIIFLRLILSPHRGPRVDLTRQ